MEQCRSFGFHLYSIWLITCNDLKSIVVPETAFGIFSALASQLTTNDDPKAVDVLSRLPQVILWNWLNVLLFDIANQRLPDSIIEDEVNKAWRPIPAGRLTPKEARRLLLVVIPLVFLGSLCLGGVVETIAMMVLTWMYNDLGGADEIYIVRNLINALGFMCYSSGSTNVAAGNHSLTPWAYAWITVVGGIIFTTLSMQDLPDVEGDAKRKRRTSPLVMGDSWCRWEIAVPILLWSAFCPTFWNSHWIGYAVTLSMGAYLSFRILCYRTTAEDAVSFQTWCLWTGIIYTLPLFAIGWSESRLD
jgi:4-hydroxybenzoate polyprenyltransferase